MKVESLITEIRYQLSDLQGLGYPVKLLLEFINDGLCLIYQLRPEAFAKSRILKGKLGSVQCLDDCCDRLLSVDSIVDACGNSLDIIRQGSTKMAALFDKPPINQHARTYKIRSNVENEFEVHPPIRSDEDVYFRVVCTSPPDAVDELNDTLPNCKHHEALINYVLYRAYAVESESETSRGLSNEAYQRMLQILGLEKAANNSARMVNEQP